MKHTLVNTKQYTNNFCYSFHNVELKHPFGTGWLGNTREFSQCPLVPFKLSTM